MSKTATPDWKLTLDGIEAFRREHIMEPMLSDEPWITEHNNTLLALCAIAKQHLSETGEHDNNLLAERRAYRKALEDIIAGGQEADAVAIAHTAITPYTPWKAVSE